MMTQVKRKVDAEIIATDHDDSMSDHGADVWAPLCVHADDAGHADYSVEAHISMSAPTTIVVAHRVCGPVDALKIAAPGSPMRADNLWRTTCFEAFIQNGSSVSSGDNAYWEVNASPSRAWATYAFSDYRTGLKQAEELIVKDIKIDRTSDQFEITTQVALSEAIEPGGLDHAAVGLACILETKDGVKSHWALAHRPGAQDFHHTDGFLLRPFRGVNT